MRQIRKSLWVIALPIMLNMLVSQLQLVIDRAFLGQLKIEYMSALGNVMAPLWASVSVVMALTTGATVLMSQALGARRPRRAERLALGTFKYNSALSVILFAGWFAAARGVFTLMGVSGEILEYAVGYTLLILPMVLLSGVNASASAVFQVSGYTRPIFIAGAVRSGLNIVLDWVLIFGNLGAPELGLEGAAIATSVAEIVGTAVLLGMLFASKRVFTRIRLRAIVRARFRYFAATVRKGLPSAGEELLWNAGNIAVIRMLNSISALATGIYTIVFSIEILPILVFISIGHAALTLAGRQTGAGDAVRARKVGTAALQYSWVVAAVCLAAFLAVPHLILRVFTSDAEIIAGSSVFLFVAAWNLFPRSANIVLGSAIRGFGDTKWMFKTQVFGTVFTISLLLVLILGFKMGIIGVFIVIILDETVRALINYRRFRKGPAARGGPGSEPAAEPVTELVPESVPREAIEVG